MSPWGRLAVWTVLLSAMGLCAVRSVWAQESEGGASVGVIVCSTTQVADFARAVVGDRWEVVCVLAPGQDPHTYQTTTADAALVARSTVCFDNGWHLEGSDWMRKLAENAGKPIVSCTDGLDPLIVMEGDQQAHDPHAWFSIPNAAHYTKRIAATIIELDPERADEYRARTDAYLMQLAALHQWVLREVNRIPPTARVLITNHDAFGYFCRDYGFRAVTPVGWSTKDEIGGGASIGRRDQVVEAIRAAGVPAIFVETSINPRAMRQLATETSVKIGGSLYSDSMGTAGSAGESYIGMMRENVLAITAALAPQTPPQSERERR